MPTLGRLRASFTPVLRPVREVLSLDWDRRRRVTPGESKSQEAWPGVEPAGRKASGQSRGGAPRGERVPPDARRAPSSVLLRKQSEDEGGGTVSGWMRLSALRLPPSFWRGSCNSLTSLGRQA